MTDTRPGAAIALSLTDTADAARLIQSLGDVPEESPVYVLGHAPDVGGRVPVRTLDVTGAAGWNHVASEHPTADLVVIGGATTLAPDTLQALAAIAHASPDAATVTPLGSSAGYLSAPARNVAYALPPSGRTVTDSAALVRDRALSLHPRIPTALPHCSLVRRSALQLVGEFDATLDERDALADFCARATAAGMVHLLADEAWVGVRSEERATTRWDGITADRHPALAAQVEEVATDRHSALARSLLAASVALEPMTVTVDARGLRAASGTVTHVLGLLGGLAARPDLQVRAVVADDAPIEIRAHISAISRLEVITEGDAEHAGRTHVVHRPRQIESLQDMAFLDLLGERTVVTNQDLIGYRTASVFPDTQSWRDYRDVTRGALGLAAMTVFFTETAAEDALAEDLVEHDRVRVVGLGIDHAEPAAGSAPTGMSDTDAPFLLILGARYRHKNLRFAMALVAALRTHHDWQGRLVIAGHEVLHGSGSGDDAAWLLDQPEHAASMLDLGAVNEAEKHWLIRHAAAVIAPSTYEGFGLMPFEAAAHGTPCLVAPVSAFRSTLPPEAMPLVPWDPVASAAAVLDLLVPGDRRDAFAAAMRVAGGAMSWETVADNLVGAYHEALRLPAPPAVRLLDQIARAERDYWAVREGLTEEQFALIRSDHPLLDERLVLDLHRTFDTPNSARRFIRALRVARGVWRRP